MRQSAEIVSKPALCSAILCAIMGKTMEEENKGRSICNDVGLYLTDFLLICPLITSWQSHSLNCRHTKTF